MSTNGNFLRYNVGSGQFNTPTLQNLVYPKLQKKVKGEGRERESGEWREGEGEGREGERETKQKRK